MQEDDSDKVSTLREAEKKSEEEASKKRATKVAYDISEQIFEKWVLEEKDRLNSAMKRGEKGFTYVETAVEWMSKCLSVISAISSKARADYERAVGKAEGIKLCLEVLTSVKEEVPAPSPAPPEEAAVRRSSKGRPKLIDTTPAERAAEIKSRKQKKAEGTEEKT